MRIKKNQENGDFSRIIISRITTPNNTNPLTKPLTTHKQKSLLTNANRLLYIY